MPQIEVRTLRQFIDSDQVIDCDCSNYWVCSHSGPLRIELAVQRFGGDFDFYQRRSELASHVYCSLCGKFHPTFRLGWKARLAQNLAASHAAILRSTTYDTRSTIQSLLGLPRGDGSPEVASSAPRGLR